MLRPDKIAPETLTDDSEKVSEHSKMPTWRSDEVTEEPETASDASEFIQEHSKKPAELSEKTSDAPKIIA